MLTGRRIGVYQIQTLLGRGRHGRGLSRARHEARARRRDQDPAQGLHEPIPTGSRASNAKPGCWRRSIIRTSARFYGVEESDGVRALVLELVEGETLAERIGAEGGPYSRVRPKRRPPRPGLRWKRSRSPARSPTRSRPRTKKGSSTAT